MVFGFMHLESHFQSYSLIQHLFNNWFRELEEPLSPVFAGGEEKAKWPLLPEAPTLKSLVEVLLDSPGFFAMFWNSLAISAATLRGQLLLDVPAAWAPARFPMKGKKSISKILALI